MASELAHASAHGGVAYPSLNHYSYASVGGSAVVSQAPANSAQQAFSSPGTTNQYNQHGAAGASGGSMQQHHQNGSNAFQFTSGPPPSRLAQQFQQQQHSVKNSTSPQPGQPTPPKQYPMAAPPLPNTPNSANNSNAGASPGSPQSPGTQSREQQRIDLLLEINNELLLETNRLQKEDKGGHISPQQVQQARSEGKPDRMASDDYIQCLRRSQANLAYLMPKAQGDAAGQAKAPPGPAHMTHPPHMPRLEEKYKRLRDLFPGWPGLDYRISGSGQSASSPSANGMTTVPSGSTPTQA